MCTYLYYTRTLTQHTSCLLLCLFLCRVCLFPCVFFCVSFRFTPVLSFKHTSLLWRGEPLFACVLFFSVARPPFFLIYEITLTTYHVRNLRTSTPTSTQA